MGEFQTSEENEVGGAPEELITLGAELWFP